jgi:hypothetical protein
MNQKYVFFLIATLYQSAHTSSCSIIISEIRESGLGLAIQGSLCPNIYFLLKAIRARKVIFDWIGFGLMGHCHANLIIALLRSQSGLPDFCG